MSCDVGKATKGLENELCSYIHGAAQYTPSNVYDLVTTCSVSMSSTSSTVTECTSAAIVFFMAGVALLLG